MIATNSTDTRSVSYLRCSSRGQVNGDTFARQDEIVSRYCQSAGLEYVAAYPEYGICGDNDIEGREALSELLLGLENGCPKTIIIEHPDRMARGMRAGVLILEDMRDADANVVCACDGRPWTIDESDPEAMLVWGIRQLFAQYDKMRLVAKMRAARVRKRRAGERCEGRKPFGHYPGEAETLQRIRDMHESGMQPGAIAAALNAAGVPTRSGKPWIRQVVGPIVRRRGA